MFSKVRADNDRPNLINRPLEESPALRTKASPGNLPDFLVGHCVCAEHFFPPVVYRRTLLYDIRESLFPFDNLMGVEVLLGKKSTLDKSL